MRRLLALAALGGCTDYAHLALHNAPGSVPDLDAPLPHENGDPARSELPTDPGHDERIVWVMPYVLGGYGMNGTQASAAGIGLRYEQSTDADAKDRTSWLAHAGIDLVQWADGRATRAPGALYGEFGLRWWARSVDSLPFELSAGPAVYLDHGSVGAQATLRLLLFVPVRVRYTRDAGLEVMLGFEVPIPFLFETSH